MQSQGVPSFKLLVLLWKHKYSSHAKKYVKGISDTQGEGTMSNTLCIFEMFVSVVFVKAMQKSLNMQGLITQTLTSPNWDWNQQNTIVFRLQDCLLNSILDFLSLFLPFGLGTPAFSNGDSIEVLWVRSVPLVHVHILTKEGRNRFGLLWGHWEPHVDLFLRKDFL